MNKTEKIFNCKCLDCGETWTKSYPIQAENDGVLCNNIRCYSENTTIKWTGLYETPSHAITSKDSEDEY